MRNVDGDTITRLLDRGEIDARLGVAPAPLPKRYRVDRLFDERLVCIACEGRPAFATGRPAMTPAEFAAWPHLLVTPPGDLSGPIDAALARHGLSRRVAVAVPHVLSAPFAVGASDLVEVMGRRFVARFAGAAGIAVHPTPVAVDG